MSFNPRKSKSTRHYRTVKKHYEPARPAGNKATGKGRVRTPSI